MTAESQSTIDLDDPVNRTLLERLDDEERAMTEAEGRALVLTREAEEAKLATERLRERYRDTARAIALLNNIPADQGSRAQKAMTDVLTEWRAETAKPEVSERS